MVAEVIETVPQHPKTGPRGALDRIGPSESQSTAEARPRRDPLPVVKYRELHDALAWFREVWDAAASRVDRLHTSQLVDGDGWGAPEWHSRFVRFIVDGAETYDPVRMAWARMRYTGGLPDRTGAVFLFVLACRDLDLRKAGLEMLGHCVCPRVHLPDCRCADPDRGRHQHGPCPSPSQPIFEEYVAWYAERAIARLRHHLENPPDPRQTERPAWMERIGFSTSGGDPSGA